MNFSSKEGGMLIQKILWLKAYGTFYRSWSRSRSRRKKYPEPVKNRPAPQHCMVPVPFNYILNTVTYVGCGRSTAA